MARHIGMVACSAGGAALCHRTLCSEAPACMGEHTHPLAEYMAFVRSGRRDGVAKLMMSSASRGPGGLSAPPIDSTRLLARAALKKKSLQRDR